MFVRKKKSRSGTTSVVVVDKHGGKTSETQIILGLLVCENGYPLAYNIFNGAQYESYTMIPIIDDFKRRFGLDDFIVVADSGFMIRRNIELPRSGNERCGCQHTRG